MKFSLKDNLLKYSNNEQEWDYIRKICMYLLKNKVKINYESIINIYFENDDKKDLIKIDRIIIPKNEIGIMIHYINLYNEKRDNIIEEIEKQDVEVKEKIEKFLERKLDGYIDKYLKFGILIPDKKIDKSIQWQV